MKGFIKTDAIDGVVRQREWHHHCICLTEWLLIFQQQTDWNSNREITESITKDELICIGDSNKE